ncbi:MAG: alpha-amylase family glycosyl hydrolase [Pseudomonadota bacterium]
MDGFTCDLDAHYELRVRLTNHLRVLYPDEDAALWADRLIVAFGYPAGLARGVRHQDRWDQGDALLITYGGSLVADRERPLVTLRRFLEAHCQGYFSGVHVLPFFPFSSDDGFSVIDYFTVDGRLGTWRDIRAIGERFRLMVDVVLNHASSESRWFRNFVADKSPGRSYFMTASPDDDLDAVARPRASPLLNAVETVAGTRHVWCTFSADQVDLDFRNPWVLREFAHILGRYMGYGVGIFRLDAVAYLWKVIGTACIHLPQTHEVIRLFRTLIEFRDENAMLITETNVPQVENLSYFGNANEAHGVYNFSLPPLLVHALVYGTVRHLDHWLMGLPPTQLGTTYINFIASHDGIGLRPTEGMLTNEEIDHMVETLTDFGGLVSMRSMPGGGERPYEINISLFDALKGTARHGVDDLAVERMLCAHAIMLALAGIPAVYIHSLLATRNDGDGVLQRGHNRAINRRVLRSEWLEAELADAGSETARVYAGIIGLLAVRREQDAFHPSAGQYALTVDDRVFAFWRRAVRARQNIFCLHNVSDETVEIHLDRVNLQSPCRCLVTGTAVADLHGTLTLPPYGFVWLSDRVEDGTN